MKPEKQTDQNMIHYVRVMTSHKTSPEGEQWVTHTFYEPHLQVLHAKIRSWESRNIPFEYQVTDSPSTLKWTLGSEIETEKEMAEEADDYDPEIEWF